MAIPTTFIVVFCFVGVEVGSVRCLLFSLYLLVGSFGEDVAWWRCGGRYRPYRTTVVDFPLPISFLPRNYYRVLCRCPASAAGCTSVCYVSLNLLLSCLVFNFCWHFLCPWRIGNNSDANIHPSPTTLPPIDRHPTPTREEKPWPALKRRS